MLSKEAIMKLMDEQIEKIDTVKYWEDTEKRFLKREQFKQLHKVRNFKEYCYYISNYGRVLVAFDKDGKFKDKINSEAELPTTYEIIPVKNGYLAKDNFQGVTLNTSTDVYNFMIEAGWLDNTEDKENAKKIVDYNIENNIYPNDRIELHHIDNNPSNNYLENLIWVPKSIHQTLHSK